jgi:hypothetical protein
MSESYEGGCLCGAVRYIVTAAPIHTFFCHCKHCQKETGGPFATEIYVPRNAVKITGEVRTHAVTGDSGKKVPRQFCGTCGCPLFTEFEIEPENICVKACSLDDPSWLKPEFHLFVKSKQPWFEITDGLPQRDGDF